MEPVRIAFETRVRVLSLEKLLPSKILPSTIMESTKYKRIAASVAEVGVVEPLVVAQAGADGIYTLLDGHVRLSVLKARGEAAAQCVVAADDEAFTYNKRVNRLAPIQEHYMIVRAIDRGVSMQKLARALNVDVAAIRQRRQLLNGIHADVAELLKDKPVGINAFQKLRKMKPIRQLEVAELMVSANNYSANYAKALLVTTRPADLVKPKADKKGAGADHAERERLVRELAVVTHDYKALEVS
nr:plasmid partitioning protein RepB C-terminal domain-containing protein [Brevundimonas diminuta]